MSPAEDYRASQYNTPEGPRPRMYTHREVLHTYIGWPVNPSAPHRGCAGVRWVGPGPRDGVAGDGWTKLCSAAGWRG